MKTIKNLNELGTLTKSELSYIASKLFNRGLRGNKDDYLTDLFREFDFYGNKEFDIILINKLLSNNYQESEEIINTTNILLLKHLPAYEVFLYKYHLGYKKLYENKIDNIEKYLVDFSYIFDNQFNTVCDKRACKFNYRLIIPSIGYKDLTTQRNNIYKCGYCGKQYTNDHDKYCTSCRASEHLSEDCYHLLELKPISNQKRDKNKELPKEVLEDILTKQKEATKQRALKDIENNKQRIIDKINEINKESEILTYLISNDDFVLLHGLYIL